MSAGNAGGERTESAGRELWRLVEESQGYAFIGDDVEGATDREALETAVRSLEWTNQSARILRKFIRKHSRRTPTEAP
jgi:hypothetical protein